MMRMRVWSHIEMCGAPQPSPGLPLRRRGRGVQRAPPPEVPPGTGHDPVREAQIAARSRWLPEAGHHLRATRRRSTGRHRPAGCPGSPAGPQGALSARRQGAETPQRDPSRRPLGSVRSPRGWRTLARPPSPTPKSMPPPPLTFAPPLGPSQRPVHAHLRVGKHRGRLHTPPGGMRRRSLPRNYAPRGLPRDSWAPIWHCAALPPRQRPGSTTSLPKSL